MGEGACDDQSLCRAHMGRGGALQVVVDACRYYLRQCFLNVKQDAGMDGDKGKAGGSGQKSLGGASKRESSGAWDAARRRFMLHEARRKSTLLQHHREKLIAASEGGLAGGFDGDGPPCGGSLPPLPPLTLALEPSLRMLFAELDLVSLSAANSFSSSSSESIAARGS